MDQPENQLEKQPVAQPAEQPAAQLSSQPANSPAVQPASQPSPPPGEVGSNQKSSPTAQTAPHGSGKILQVLLYGLFVVIFLWVCGQLFFEKEVDRALQFTRGFLFESIEEKVSSITDLRVIYPQEPTSLESTLDDPITRQRLVNIYEPLVKPDAYLSLRPALALSWGLIDDHTWEFALRPDVIFHDGSSFDVEDVVASVERAGSYPDSELRGMLDSIEDFEILDDLTLRVKTNIPDPLLLHKLAHVLIIPSEYEEEKLPEPIGTGSYKFDSWEFEEKIMVFKRFDGYWGEAAKFDKVKMISILDKSDRVNTFLRGDADLLAFVAYDAVSTVEERGFEIAAIPTLEVQFLLFDMNSKFLRDTSARKAVSLALDQDALTELLGRYARPVGQFVSNGIFGFNPNISEHEYDLESAKDLAKESKLEGKTLHFHLPIGLDVLGEHVRKGLNEIGVFVIVSYMEMDKLLESIENKTADIYFFGFKSALGDALEFLQSIVHSEGDFNVFDYENANVDYLVEVALVELDPHKRRDALQEAMKIVVEEDVVGVPLFEYETVFSFADAIEMQPRIDGLIYFDELIVN